MKKSVLYTFIALLASLFQFTTDSYPIAKLILKNQFCTSEFQNIKKNLQKSDLLIYTDEEELESFFLKIKNSLCQKNL